MWFPFRPYLAYDTGIIPQMRGVLSCVRLRSSSNSRYLPGSWPRGPSLWLFGSLQPSVRLARRNAEANAEFKNLSTENLRPSLTSGPKDHISISAYTCWFYGPRQRGIPEAMVCSILLLMWSSGALLIAANASAKT